MRRIAERRTTQRVAADQLGLTVRQVERLYAAYKLVRGQYADFGPTLAHETLLEVHGIHVSGTTVRQWMIADGAWTTRREQKKRVQQPRYRRACLGEFVQIDGASITGSRIAGRSARRSCTWTTRRDG